MQEDILNIKLIDQPPKVDSQSKDSSYSGRLNNRAKYFIIVYFSFLIKYFCNKTSLGSFNETISLTLEPKYPFGYNYIIKMMIGNKYPSVIFVKSIVLFHHGNSLLIDTLRVTCWFSINRESPILTRSGVSCFHIAIKKSTWSPCIVLGAGDHMMLRWLWILIRKKGWLERWIRLWACGRRKWVGKDGGDRLVDRKRCL